MKEFRITRTTMDSDTVIQMLETIGAIQGYKIVTWVGYDSSGNFRMQDDAYESADIPQCIQDIWGSESCLAITVRQFNDWVPSIWGFIIRNNTITKLEPQDVASADVVPYPNTSYM